MNTLLSAGESGIRKASALGMLVALGIVFGDIGTSPLYMMKAIVGVNPRFSESYILGAVSCVIWTLTLQTTLKYVIIALRADNNGEGGILALYSLLKRLRPRWLYLAAAIGAAALIADGVITPAITVTSAVEGLRVIGPGVPVLPIALLIIVGIFFMQQAGTRVIGRYFGPFMLAWFLMLGVLGICNIPAHAGIFRAFNPWYAIKLLIEFPQWFLVLGAVFLCTTGAEALYSDLGHCGRMNISYSWIFVKIMLILNYLGQGAWLIANSGHVGGENPFYAIMPGWFMPIGIIMSTGAAIIASQALLSGSFTLFSEAAGLDFWPMQRVKYPTIEKGQLYIPSVNWCLMVGCIVTLLLFRDSSHMEGAYGLAITVTMLMTTLLLSVYLHHKGVRLWICIVFLTFFVILEGMFFTANLFKFMHGGWFTTLIAALVCGIMVIWRNSTRLRNSYIEYQPMKENLEVIRDIQADKSIPLYSSNLVYFSRSENPEQIESKLVYSIINRSPKRADHYWIIHIVNSDIPDQMDYTVDVLVPRSVFFVKLYLGFRVDRKISRYLRQVIEDMVEANELDLTSQYPALRKRGIAGDFRFVILHRIFSPASNCPLWRSRLLRWHEKLRKWIAMPDRETLGLDTSIVVVEAVPLIIDGKPLRRIRPLLVIR